MRRANRAATGTVRRLGGLVASALGVAGLLTIPAATGPGQFSADGGNWSGYVTTGKNFHSVSARWAEPAVTCTSRADMFAPWVGLDGYGGGDTVEQTGVATDCSSGKPVYRAWHETAPDPPVYYPLPIQAGDVIAAEVTRRGNSYTMTLADLTRNWRKTAVKKSPGTNTSAEVALEAQAGRFPQFGRVDFTDATVDGRPLASVHPTAIDSTDDKGFLTATGTLSGGRFTVGHLQR